MGVMTRTAAVYNGRQVLGVFLTASALALSLTIVSQSPIGTHAAGAPGIPGTALGLGRQRLRPAGQRHHHDEQQHPGCGQPALGDHCHRHRRLQLPQPGADPAGNPT
jgi:hypothetical protein